MTRTQNILALRRIAAIVSSTLAAFMILPGAAHAATGSAYGWPVKPFDREHPVRGSFGDPRTVFQAPPTSRALMTSAGSFSFHQGVDISAPNGTPVYPVASGVVSAVSHEWVRIDSGDGRAFEYWHIRPLVRVGQSVERNHTILGPIVKPAMHVHLTELASSHPVNPLQSGHLTPYSDTTAPRVASIKIRTRGGIDEGMPGFVRGRVDLRAEAYDMPSMPVPGIWHGLPVTPALITWRIQSWNGNVVVPERIARDVRRVEPQNSAFWSTYARGSYQNMAVFGPHYSYLQQGCYLFRLTSSAFDTRQLHDGVYDVVVTATDIRGNHGSLATRITVHNRPGWIGS